MATLVHVDERAAAPLAQKIERIRSVEQAYKLDQFIRDARERKGAAWALSPQDVTPFIDATEQAGGEVEVAAEGSDAKEAMKPEASSSDSRS